MELNVLDHVTKASSYDDGDIIFRLIEPRLVAGEMVTLSFSGIDAVPSAFINASIVRLAERLSLDDVRGRLRITNSTKQINDLIRGRIGFLQSLSKTGEISLSQNWEVVYWSRMLEVTPDKLREAVHAVGTNVAAVRAYLHPSGN